MVAIWKWPDRLLVKIKELGNRILRDHNRVQGHCDRFNERGRYYPWVKEDMLLDWLVIDCATTPGGTHLSFICLPFKLLTLPDPSPEKNVWRAIFSEDFSEVRIFDNTNTPITEPIALTN